MYSFGRMAVPDHSTTVVWRETLAQQKDDQHRADRERLRVAYANVRTRASALATQIEVDLSEFTVHDVTHMDRLWELLDVIRGEDVDLNPAEAFVLGGAILVHDLGMAAAAYPGGIDEIRRGDDYRDALAVAVRSELGRTATKEEVDNAGSVHFTPAGQGTEVRVLLRYDPPAGALGAAVAKLFGEEPSQQVAEDLRRLKQVMEAGEVASTSFADGRL